jgi:hypothetical protein
MMNSGLTTLTQHNAISSKSSPTAKHVPLMNPWLYVSLQLLSHLRTHSVGRVINHQLVPFFFTQESTYIGMMPMRNCTERSLLKPFIVWTLHPTCHCKPLQSQSHISSLPILFATRKLTTTYLLCCHLEMNINHPTLRTVILLLPYINARCSNFI